MLLVGRKHDSSVCRLQVSDSRKLPTQIRNLRSAICNCLPSPAPSASVAIRVVGTSGHIGVDENVDGLFPRRDFLVRGNIASMALVALVGFEMHVVVQVLVNLPTAARRRELFAL